MAQPATPMQPRRESTPSTPPKLVPAADLVKRLQELHESIARRAYEIFESKGRTSGRDLEDWLQAESQFLHPVHVDVADSDDGLTVRAEVPGFRGENLMVGAEARRLTIAGKREAEEERRNEKTIYRESCSDQILRVIDLPAEVVAAKAVATLRDGVLELKMPKAAPAKKVAPSNVA
jgi:HSP20 family protein